MSHFEIFWKKVQRKAKGHEWNKLEESFTNYDDSKGGMGSGIVNIRGHSKATRLLSFFATSPTLIDSLKNQLL